MTPLFTGQIINGILHLTEKQKFTDYLKTLEGKEVECVVGKREYIRTLPQNSWYWVAVVQIPADSFGYTKEEMHALYGYMFRKSEKEIKGKIYQYVKST